jgi:ATP adenylyltransferase
LSYVTDAAAASRGDCVFCVAQNDRTSTSLILAKAESCFVILNLYPYNNGHLMVVPNRHIAALAEASREELAELMVMTQHAEVALTEAYRPDGMNLGINLGRPAGAGIPGHLHLHLVPRWDGDTNFMTVVGSTRVVPEEPAQTIKRLSPIFKRLVRDE